ncbi:melanocortin receptor 5-like [Actinia tenebrosa]|uniref:Melanocortin receptor 5-like n=1 Tax=Actinia tenebrosa TaxID=6105 RepID=A0A6P8HTI9_ACTTE|nr:melanocortin receptor 5-like [Actinia tenebrosa]
MDTNSTNATSSLLGKSCQFSRVASIVFIFLHVLSSVLAITGNSLVLLAVYKSQRLRNVSNFFLCSLGFADFLVGAIMNPLYATFMALFMTSTRLPFFLFKISDFLTCQTLVASTISLCSVSIDRYIAIKWPLRYHLIMSDKKCGMVISCVWLFSIAMGIPQVILSDRRDLKLFGILSSAITAIVPLSVIVFCYVQIVAIAREQSRMLAGSTHGPSHQERIRIRAMKFEKAALTFVLIAGVFVLTFTPHLVLSFVHVFVREDATGCSFHKKYGIWFILLMFSSSFLNPIIYSARSREFRNAFKRLLKLHV